MANQCLECKVIFPEDVTKPKLIGPKDVTFVRGMAKDGFGFDEYMKSEIKPMLRSGRIAESDLKLRVSNVTVTDSGIEIAVGPTNYYEYAADYETFYGEFESREVMENIRRDLINAPEHERQLRLSRPLGLTAILITPDGKASGGVRRKKEGRKGVTEYVGAIHNPAGYLTFNKDVSKLDPMADLHFVLELQAYIFNRDIDKIMLAGIAANPKTLETDLVYFVYTNFKSLSFLDRWEKADETARKHFPRFAFDKPQLKALLETGVATDGKHYEILYPTNLGYMVFLNLK